MGWADRTRDQWEPVVLYCQLLERWRRASNTVTVRNNLFLRERPILKRNGKIRPILQGFTKHGMKSVNLGVDADARVFAFFVAFCTFSFSLFICNLFFIHYMLVIYFSPLKLLPDPPHLPMQPTLCSFSVSNTK